MLRRGQMHTTLLRLLNWALDCCMSATTTTATEAAADDVENEVPDGDKDRYDGVHDSHNHILKDGKP